MLDRLGEALRGRDWFGVLVEIGAVVLGVLLGLQASQWADDRREARERSLLTERLVTDLRDYAKVSDGIEANRTKRIKELTWLVHTLESGRLQSSDRQRAAEAIDDAMSFDDAQPLPIAVENLVSSQSLDRVDPVARAKLEELARLHARQAMGQKLFHDHVLSHLDMAEELLPSGRVDFLGGNLNAIGPDQVDFSKLDDPEARIMISESLRRDGLMRWFDDNLAKAARAAADALETKPAR